MTLPDDRQYTNPVPDRRQTQTARQAAEALFKPKQHAAPVAAPTMPLATAPTATEPDTPRKPRILSAALGIRVSAGKLEAPTGLAPTQRRRETSRKVGKVPSSAHGRIKVLTTYGMTVEDVADLYGVSASEIDRIVARTPP
jgi:hypothetical protein